ncbi:DUF4156 domain-containing protein [Aliivibrio fischeri]|uniref:DUF4156 domain-containing protein n=1 Tax=Aliivibrio fischeri TaxID=668 RepID=UPI001F46AB00|nr:DUF4156 domain-containing protein [Aliivibrio fischeri]
MGALLLNGCVIAPSLKGNMVRMVDSQSNCKFITAVIGSNSTGWDSADNTEGALNDVKNKTASAGANAVRIVILMQQQL